MKRVLLYAGILLILLFPGANAQAEKIGFVDVREIMMNSEAGQKASEEFKKMYEKNRLLIQGSEVELKKMKDEIEKQRSVLTDVALKEKEATYQKRFQSYQALVKEANDDLQGKDQELSKTMIPEIQKILNAIGEKEKFTVIFDVSAVPIPFHSKGADVTKRVMEEFNKSYKGKTK
jgi:outer membrane protein